MIETDSPTSGERVCSPARMSAAAAHKGATGHTAARSWTLVGLAIAMLAIPSMVSAFRLFLPQPLDAGGTVARELAAFGLLALLLRLASRREKLGLRTIGLHFDHIQRSLLRSIGLLSMMAISLAGILIAYRLFGVVYGQSGPSAPALPASIWLLTVVRAGLVEEVFYRGYAIERLEMLTGSCGAAAMLPLACFTAVHYRQGMPGLFVVLVLGSILTVFYVWKRDLVANIIAHSAIDFIPHVLLPALSAR